MVKLGTQTVEEKKAGDDGLAVTVVSDDVRVPEPSTTARVVRGKRLSDGQRRCLKFLIVILLLSAIAMGALGGYYIYRSVSYNKYQGTCKVSLKSGKGSSRQYLKEDVNITNNEETINVPKFDDNDAAVFYHDFVREVSLIKDISDKVCYVLPLNKNLIPPPRTLLDVIIGMQNGDYVYDADKIQTGYKVVRPELAKDHLKEEYGQRIAELCANYSTYRLQEIDMGVVTTTTTAAPSYYLVRRYIVFPGGTRLVQYYIIKQ